jgi:hypothetical protein
VDSPDDRWAFPFNTNEPESPDARMRHNAEAAAEETGKPCDIYALRFDVEKVHGKEIPGTRERLMPIQRRLPPQGGSGTPQNNHVPQSPAVPANPAVAATLNFFLQQLGLPQAHRGVLASMILWLEERQRAVQVLRKAGVVLEDAEPLPDVLERVLRKENPS